MKIIQFEQHFTTTFKPLTKKNKKNNDFNILKRFLVQLTMLAPNT